MTPGHVYMLYWIRISIHTPAKGVTSDVAVSDIDKEISIHTPAKGVTRFKVMQGLTWDISIHTPAKGVTDAPDIK